MKQSSAGHKTPSSLIQSGQAGKPPPKSPSHRVVPQHIEVVWTGLVKSLLSRPVGAFQTRFSCGETVVPHATPHRFEQSHKTQRLHAHRPYLCLATIAIAIIVLISLAGCQTPPAPAYGSTIAPPATGMINQPAPYGSFVGTPQGAAYPSSAPMAGGAPMANAAPVMPGPANGWQSAAPAAPANSWSWAQSGQPAAAGQQAGQQYGAPALNNPANNPTVNPNQYQQNLTNQTQQMANQLQAQPQQWANQQQQALANQQQQLTNQVQNTTNQYQQGMQQTLQNQQQQLSGQMQQINNQMQPVAPGMPQQQTVNGNWWPFTNPNGLPPPRATPALPARY